MNDTNTRLILLLLNYLWLYHKIDLTTEVKLPFLLDSGRASVVKGISAPSRGSYTNGYKYNSYLFRGMTIFS